MPPLGARLPTPLPWHLIARGRIPASQSYPLPNAGRGGIESGYFEPIREEG